MQQLFRSSVDTVSGMAMCGYLLRDWESANRDIATATIINAGHPEIRLIRSLMLLDCFGSRPDWQESIAKECHKELTELKKDHMDFLSPEMQE